jgi:hypothetical protein
LARALGGVLVLVLLLLRLRLLLGLVDVLLGRLLTHLRGLIGRGLLRFPLLLLLG